MKLLFWLLFPLALFADRVMIVSRFFDLSEMPLQRSKTEEAGFDIELHYSREPLLDPKDPQLKRIIAMNPCIDFPELMTLPKEKLVLFLWEPLQLPSAYYDRFSRVYTWDDTLVDGMKFFKLYYPHLRPQRSRIPPFEAKKFCTLIASNWTEARRKMIAFFLEKPAGELEFYGRVPADLSASPLYRGEIPGDHSGPEKYDLLKDYKFCICFENTQTYAGYITEKIFGCFAAACVPIYWGATNIERYIPKDCYIDYRDFKSDEALYKYLKTMKKERYENYLTAARKFLQSPEAEIFSAEHFDRTLYEAVH